MPTDWTTIYILFCCVFLKTADYKLIILFKIPSTEHHTTVQVVWGYIKDGKLKRGQGKTFVIFQRDGEIDVCSSNVRWSSQGFHSPWGQTCASFACDGERWVGGCLDGSWVLSRLSLKWFRWRCHRGKQKVHGGEERRRNEKQPSLTQKENLCDWRMETCWSGVHEE